MQQTSLNFKLLTKRIQVSKIFHNHKVIKSKNKRQKITAWRYSLIFKGQGLQHLTNLSKNQLEQTILSFKLL
jgi:hypothetical protein